MKEESDDETETEEEDGDEPEEQEGTSSAVRLKQWYQRTNPHLGYATPGARSPLIDQIHRLMHFWEAGEEGKLIDYLADQRLKENEHFPHLLQALIELEGVSSEEKGILERLSKFIERTDVTKYRLF